MKLFFCICIMSKFGIDYYFAIRYSFSHFLWQFDSSNNFILSPSNDESGTCYLIQFLIGIGGKAGNGLNNKTLFGNRFTCFLYKPVERAYFFYILFNIVFSMLSIAYFSYCSFSAKSIQWPITLCMVLFGRERVTTSSILSTFWE